MLIKRDEDNVVSATLHIQPFLDDTKIHPFVPFSTPQIPVVNVQVKMVPAICTFIGAIFSCTNYFRVIFTGGVGKNGSTIAVRLSVYLCLCKLYLMAC